MHSQHETETISNQVLCIVIRYELWETHHKVNWEQNYNFVCHLFHVLRFFCERHDQTNCDNHQCALEVRCKELEAELIKQDNCNWKHNTSEQEGKPVERDPIVVCIKIFPERPEWVKQLIVYVFSVINHECSRPNGKQDYQNSHRITNDCVYLLSGRFPVRVLQYKQWGEHNSHRTFHQSFNWHNPESVVSKFQPNVFKSFFESLLFYTFFELECDNSNYHHKLYNNNRNEQWANVADELSVYHSYCIISRL